MSRVARDGPNNAGRSAFSTLTGQAAKGLAQVASIVLLSRLILPDDFGLLAIVLAIVGFVEAFRDFGLSLAAIRVERLSQAEASNLFWLNTLVGLLLCVLLLLSAPGLALAFGQPALRDISSALSLVFLLNGMGTQVRVAMVRQHRFATLAIIDAGAPVFALLCALIAASFERSYWALVAQQLSFYLFLLIATWLASGWLPSGPSRHTSVRTFISFSLPLLATRAITFAGMNFDKVVVGKFFGPAVTGQYSRAYQMFALPMNQAVAPLTNLAVSVLSRARDRGESSFFASLQKMQLLSCYFGAVVLSLLAGLAGPIVRIALGQNWLGTIPLLQILAIGGIFQICGISYFWAFVALNKPRLHLRCALFTQPLSVVFVLGGLPFGVLGVSAGASLALFLEWAVSAVYAAPRMGLAKFHLLSQAAVPIALGFLLFGSLLVADALSVGSTSLYALLCVVLPSTVLMLFFILPRFREDLWVLLGFARSLKSPSGRITP